MNIDRIEFIRLEEKKYHDFCYDNYKLFEEGSWLHKPVKTVMDLLSFFQFQEEVQVLDLGCGVGRNSIPIAEKIKDQGGKVTCVDLLESAIGKLQQYSAEYKVDNFIQTEIADISNYEIKPNEYDYIVAVSSLEHIHSEATFEKVVQDMAKGTKNKGINCLIVNSNVREIDMETNRKMDALVEVNLQTEEMMHKLQKIYQSWQEIIVAVKPLEFMINRNGRSILLKTDAITFVVRKMLGG